MNKNIIVGLSFCLSIFLVSCSVPRVAGPYKEVKSKNTVQMVEQPIQRAQPSQPPQTVRQEAFKAESSHDANRLNLYNVIIGSFSKRQNAINLRDAQKPQYNPIIVTNEIGMFRVILVSYKTYEEAKKKVSEIADRFPDAWVLMQKQ